MEKNLDLDAMRSRYSDLTVTAIPKGTDKPEPNLLVEEPNPQVEITRVPIDRTKENFPAAAAPQAGVYDDPLSSDVCKEYAAVAARLDEVRFQRHHLKLLSSGLPFHYDGVQPPTNMDLKNAISALLNTDTYPFFPGLDSQNNIVKKYAELLEVVSRMHNTIPLCYLGLRIPKERLQVDINNARALLQDCRAILDQEM